MVNFPSSQLEPTGGNNHTPLRLQLVSVDNQSL